MYQALKVLLEILQSEYPRVSHYICIRLSNRSFSNMEQKKLWKQYCVESLSSSMSFCISAIVVHTGSWRDVRQTCLICAFLVR